MSRLTMTTLLLLALANPVFATDTPVRNTRETAADGREVANDRAGRERDSAELVEFRQFVAGLCDAYEDRMPGRYREINARMQKAMAREIEQARLKRTQAVNEERRSRRGQPDDRMEASLPGDASGMGQVFDDRRDGRSAVNRSEEMSRVGTLSSALQNEIARGDRAAMARNIELAGSFLALMRADANADRAGSPDDRGELREEGRAQQAKR